MANDMGGVGSEGHGGISEYGITTGCMDWTPLSAPLNWKLVQTMKYIYTPKSSYPNPQLILLLIQNFIFISHWKHNNNNNNNILTMAGNCW